MKKLPSNLAALTLGLFCFSSCYAEPFQGFYAGVLGGGSFLDGTENSMFTRRFVPDPNQASFAIPAKHGIKSNTLIGMGVLGYGETFSNNGYLGGEFFVDWSNHSDTTHEAAQTINQFIFSHHHRLKVCPFSYGVDLRPGYIFNDLALFYARLGVGIKRVTQSLDADVGFQDGTNNHAASISSKSVTRAVLRLGLGFEYALIDNLTFRADYIFTYLGKYNHFTAGSGISAGGPVVTGTGTNSLLMVDNSFLFGVCWHW